MHTLERVLDLELSGNAKEFRDPIRSQLKAHEKTKSSSVMAIFNQEDKEETTHEVENIRRANLKALELTRDEIKIFFPRTHDHVLTAFKYIEDTHVSFSAHLRNRIEAQKRGVDWRENSQVTKILVCPDSRTGETRIAGVVLHTGEYIYGSHLHMSGGYRVAYRYDPDSKARFQSHFKVLFYYFS